MKIDNWRDTVISPEATLSASLRSLETTALQIVLILDDDGRLQGTLTDGDVRRALLRGATLDSPVSAHARRDPITIAAGTDSLEVIQLLKRLAVRSAPVVDARGRVVDLVTFSELHAPVERETPAVVMAGGRGVRLRPLTDRTPKPLISIAGEPLIDITTRRLVAHGFRRIWVTTHYRASDIKEHLGDGEHLGAEIRYITEPKPLGTVGAVREVPVSGLDAPILVCNSDNLHMINFGALVDHHVSMGAWATLAVTQHVTEVPYGVVKIEKGSVSDLVEKPRRVDWVATGVSVVTQQALALFPQGQRLDVPMVITELIHQGLPVVAFENTDYWTDVGNPDTLNQVQTQHQAGISTQGR